jgi:hydroxymethylpyrimidine pyrophosphatase-like HAD family hydrolase
VNPSNGTKATGIAKLTELYSIDTKDIYTIGDNYNDILMLSAFNSSSWQTRLPK